MGFLMHFYVNVGFHRTSTANNLVSGQHTGEAELEQCILITNVKSQCHKEML